MLRKIILSCAKQQLTKQNSNGEVVQQLNPAPQEQKSSKMNAVIIIVLLVAVITGIICAFLYNQTNVQIHKTPRDRLDPQHIKSTDPNNNIKDAHQYQNSQNEYKEQFHHNRNEQLKAPVVTILENNQSKKEITHQYIEQQRIIPENILQYMYFEDCNQGTLHEYQQFGSTYTDDTYKNYYILTSANDIKYIVKFGAYIYKDNVYVINDIQLRNYNSKSEFEKDIYHNLSNFIINGNKNPKSIPLIGDINSKSTVKQIPIIQFRVLGDNEKYVADYIKNKYNNSNYSSQSNQFLKALK